MLFDFMQVNNKYTSPASKNVGEIFKTNVSVFREVIFNTFIFMWEDDYFIPDKSKYI